MSCYARPLQGVPQVVSATFLGRLAVGVAASVAVCAAALASSDAARLRCTITAKAPDGTIVGTNHADVICGSSGADAVYAKGGNDVVYAGAGNDVIYPGAGRDLVDADQGSDLIYSLDGHRDVINGGPGLDRARTDKLDRSSGVERFFPRSEGPDPVLVTAGDIASCQSTGDSQTAALLDAFPYAPVLPLGDDAYPNGTAFEFRNCYAPTWGRAKARSKPTPGNHDYLTPGAQGYFGYFGSLAGDPRTGYYSYDLGSWHVISLNSNCPSLPGGCGPGSPEDLWLRQDLLLHPAACTLAYWHHPRFSSGTEGPDVGLTSLWQTLYDNGADVVLNGHDHGYERFAPQDSSGRLDALHGIREFTVGTGGASHGSFPTPQPNSELRNNDSYGVLRMILHPTSYDWEFVPVAGKTFTDSGTAACS